MGPTTGLEQEISSQKRYIITLVHGTFSKRASWTQEGSLLRLALEQLLDAPVEFQSVSWSGRNTVVGRKEGANKLVEELRRQMNDPRAILFIVAHSHGGNLVLTAMDDDDVRSRIAGIATMGTPFIVATRHMSTYWDMKYLLAGLSMYLLVVAISTLGYLLPHMSLFSAITIQVGVLAVLLILATRFFYFIEHRSNDAEDALKFPSMQTSKMLILRNAGDEASIALQFSQFISLIPFRLFASTLNIAEIAANQPRRQWAGQQPRVWVGQTVPFLAGILTSTSAQ